MEYLGSGIPRILEKYDEPVFHFTEHFLRIVFKYEEEIPQGNGVESGVELVSESNGLVDGLVDGLVENQKKILQILKIHPFSSIRELANQLKISTTAVDKNINMLKRKELLKRVGTDRGGHWEVIGK